jgi:hypothetical protein
MELSGWSWWVFGKQSFDHSVVKIVTWLSLPAASLSSAWWLIVDAVSIVDAVFCNKIDAVALKWWQMAQRFYLRFLHSILLVVSASLVKGQPLRHQLETCHQFMNRQPFSIPGPFRNRHPFTFPTQNFQLLSWLLYSGSWWTSFYSFLLAVSMLVAFATSSSLHSFVWF